MTDWIDSPNMRYLRTFFAMATLFYASIVLIAPLTRGQESTNTVQGQQILDHSRRLDNIERMAIGERLARMETQLEAAAKSAERSANLITAALVGLLGLIGDMIVRLFQGKRKT